MIFNIASQQNHAKTKSVLNWPFFNKNKKEMTSNQKPVMLYTERLQLWERGHKILFYFIFIGSFWKSLFDTQPDLILYFIRSMGKASQVALVVKSLPARTRDAGDAGLISGSGRSTGVGNGNPL